MFLNLKNFLKKFKLDIFCLIFSISQLGLNKENNEILNVYIRNIDWIYTLIIVITAVIIVLILLLLVAYAILLERKILGSIQKRRGPNLVGIFGLLQPIADAIKLIIKETIIPVSSNRVIFIIAPLLTLILSLLNWSIIPFSNFAVLADIRVSILMFFAISSLSVYGIIMSGWSSNSKYAFLGALRAAAQIIAYEVSIGLTLIYILLQTSDLNYSKIIINQIGIWNIIPCFIFFFLFFISTLAETNRPPFDLPEAEAELVSGYNVEYSAMTFGFFFLGEYVAIWTVCCLNIILFWGGYWIIYDYKSIFIYSLKVILFVIIFIWIRGSLPRYRYDQLMRLGWKILLPISLGFVVLYSGYFYFKFYTFLLLNENSIDFLIYMDQTGKNTFLLDIKSQFGGIDAEKIKSKGSFANFVKKYVELVIQRDKEAEELVKILGNIKENNKDYIKVIIQKCIEIEDAAMYEVKFEEFRNEFIEFVTQKCIEGGFEELVKYYNNFHNEYIEFVTQKYKESDEFAEFLYPFAFNLEEILEFKNFLEKHEIYIWDLDIEILNINEKLLLDKEKCESMKQEIQKIQDMLKNI